MAEEAATGQATAAAAATALVPRAPAAASAALYLNGHACTLTLDRPLLLTHEMKVSIEEEQDPSQAGISKLALINYLKQRQQHAFS